MLSILLVVATVAVGARTYVFWKRGPWDLPTSGKAVAPVVAAEPKAEAKKTAVVNLDPIINNNLFDPERGAGRTREVEASSRSLQRIKSLVLLGTAVLGSNRYAMLQDGGDRSAPQGRSPELLRFKVGDTVDGFTLSEIRDRNVVFSKGASRVELALDYFRKVEPPAPPSTPAGRPGSPAGQVTPAAPAAPGVVPSFPRRQRLPAPPNP